PAVPPSKPAPKPPAVKVAAMPAPSGNWRVQLGAFSDAAKASALWASLHARVAALGSYRSFTTKAGAVTRLQAGPLPTRAAADALCAKVKAAGAPCLPVAP
ncbi:MAG: SPOR domain-containing protein, partial [Sphingomonadaceae bacterium]|nr:SPOR domain-containing protein [Sphingomonadaceae bacterium]